MTMLILNTSNSCYRNPTFYCLGISDPLGKVGMTLKVGQPRKWHVAGFGATRLLRALNKSKITEMSMITPRCHTPADPGSSIFWKPEKCGTH